MTKQKAHKNLQLHWLEKHFGGWHLLSQAHI